MEARVNPVVASGPGTLGQITCFRCGEKGHLARNCRRPPRRRDNDVNRKPSGKGSERTEGSRPTVAFHLVGCISTEKCDYVTLELDVSKGDKLFFLVDSGADISPIRGKRLLETTEFEPRDRVRAKSIDGSGFETHGSIATRIKVDGLEIPYSFQLVDKQVDLKGDGILGRDFLKVMQAHICYRERLLSFQYEGNTVCRKLEPPPGCEGDAPHDRSANRLTIPARTEMIVRLPVKVGTHVTEDLVGKLELLTGVYLADSLVKVNSDHVITSVLNTREQEIEIPTPEVQLTQLRDSDTDEAALLGFTEQDEDRVDQGISRGERVIDKLRTDHLNTEERKSLSEICFDYQDIFYLPGDKLSSTDVVRHSIQL